MIEKFPVQSTFLNLVTLCFDPPDLPARRMAGDWWIEFYFGRSDQ